MDSYFSFVLITKSLCFGKSFDFLVFISLINKSDMLKYLFYLLDKFIVATKLSIL